MSLSILQPGLQYLETAAWLSGVAAVAAAVGLVIHLIVWKSLQRITARTGTMLDDIMIRRWSNPTRLLLVLFIAYLLLPGIAERVPDTVITVGGDLLTVVLVAAAAWTLIRLAAILEEMLLKKYEVEKPDNLQARRIHTQVKILKRIAITVIVILSLSVVFLSFDRFRQLGAGILASAGIVGIIVGLAAQRTLGNLLAGIQIAITQPIRLDDVVIVENEWGWIEEITLTYVVVRIWDLRRMVLPISYFIEKPFQNWTRVSADILGTVFIYADYTIPVDRIRAELTSILERSEYWDGKVNVVQVTSGTERSIEIRALMSAKDSPTAWNLRCEVREGLLSFLQKEFPECLPRSRVELDRGASK